MPPKNANTAAALVQSATLRASKTPDVLNTENTHTIPAARAGPNNMKTKPNTIDISQGLGPRMALPPTPSIDIPALVDCSIFTAAAETIRVEPHRAPFPEILILHPILVGMLVAILIGATFNTIKPTVINSSSAHLPSSRNGNQSWKVILS